MRWIALIAILAGCHRATLPLPVATSSLGNSADLVERGEYIVRNVSVCGSCHTQDRKPDGPLSGGTEFKDWRLGTIRSANLTPDSATGLGTWSESEIVRAIRNGQRKDGQLLAPVMRYEWFHEMSDRDAFAVARYLKSLPAVSHRVTQNPNLVFRVARSSFLGPVKRNAPAPSPREATAAYGQYLSHIALCVDCHTPTSGLQSKLDRGNGASGAQSHSASRDNVTWLRVTLVVFGLVETRG